MEKAVLGQEEKGLFVPTCLWMGLWEEAALSPSKLREASAQKRRCKLFQTQKQPQLKPAKLIWRPEKQSVYQFKETVSGWTLLALPDLLKYEL